MTIPSGFHPTLCHDHAEVKPCPKCAEEDAAWDEVFSTVKATHGTNLMNLIHFFKVTFPFEAEHKGDKDMRAGVYTIYGIRSCHGHGTTDLEAEIQYLNAGPEGTMTFAFDPKTDFNWKLSGPDPRLGKT